ncbi:MAG: hypothetical protein ACRD1M_12400 [Terriglobales bacterium]
MVPPSAEPVAAAMPPPTAQVAIWLGFLLGVWGLLSGFYCWITRAGLAASVPGVPWAAWGAGSAVLGAAWMVAGNLYLFQNRGWTWKAVIVLLVLSSWSAGWAVAILAVQLVLLLLPATRRGLSG